MDRLSEIELGGVESLLGDCDSVASIPKILLIDSFSYTRRSLLASIRSINDDAFLFLKFTSVVWPDRDGMPSCEGFLLGLWNIFTRATLVICCCLMIFNFAYYAFQSNWFRDTDGDSFWSWVLDIFFIVQAVALLASLISVRRRLESISTELELSFLSSSLKIATIYLSLSFFPSILYPLYHLIVVPSPKYSNEPLSFVQFLVYSILPISELVIAGFLAVHMLFILLDFQSLVSTFLKLREENSIDGVSPTTLSVVLTEINRRVGTSLLTSAPVIVVAILELIVLGSMLYDDYLQYDYLPIILLIFLFLKEIQLFLVVAMLLLYYLSMRVCLVYKRRE